MKTIKKKYIFLLGLNKKSKVSNKKQTKYAVVETKELEQNITPSFQREGFCSRDQILQFHLQIIQLNLCLMRDFSNINVIKCNNACYGVWLEKETLSFCDPIQEHWYFFPWSLVKMMIKRAFPMSEDEILEAFHLADNYDSRIHQ